MVMEEGLDSGPVLLQASTTLGGHETAGELLPRLAHLGAALLLETVARLEVGSVMPREQLHAEATLAPRLKKEDGRVDWKLPASAVGRRLRAFSPWPGLFTELRGEPVKLLVADAMPTEALAVQGGAELPGTLLGVRDGALLVAAGEGTTLAVRRLQRPGRRVVDAGELANGEHLVAGERFG
jgi:methionyl-tRNA formyltransferase